MKWLDRLSGVFAPLTTPFIDDEVDYKGLEENLERFNASGLKGYFALGTNGEFKSLSVEERFRVLEVVVRTVSKDKTVMAGTGCESTRETIALSERAAKVGAQFVSLLTPSFFAKRMSDEVLASYILEVAEASPVPVLIYNNPSVAAGVCVSPAVVERVSGHPNMAGMKDSSKGNYPSYLKAAKEDFALIAGSADFFLDLLKAGGIGGVLSLANVFPDECVAVYRAFRAGRGEEAAEKNATLLALNKEVSGSFGVAGVKAAMDLAGFKGGPPRRPLRGLTGEQFADLRKKLLDIGVLSG
jgi:4-hydroxy-2-oxoglutarate aldolase